MAIFASTRDRRCMEHNGVEHLAIRMDTCDDEEQNTYEYRLVIQETADLFPGDLSGEPPE